MTQLAITRKRAEVLAVLVLLGCNDGKGPIVVGEGSKYTWDEPPSHAATLLSERRLHLRAVRGETLGLQVFTAKRGSELALRLPKEIARVDAFRVGYVDVKEGSTSMYGTSLGTGQYPDPLFSTAAPVQAERQAYFDIAVGVDAEPGVYEGELLENDTAFPVTLKVEPIRIDVERHPLVWVFYHPKEVARAHGVPDDNGPEQIALETAYHDLFRAHGALLATNLRPDRFEARAGFVRDVRYWPVSVDTTTEETIAADVQTWLSLFRDRPVTPFTIPVDEPSTPAQRHRAKSIADHVKKAGGGAPLLLRAVTDRTQPLYGDSFDLYFAPDDIPHVASARRPAGELFWTYNGRPPQAGSMIIDTEGTALRTWGWVAYRYDIDLWYAWEGLYFSDRYNDGEPTDVFTDPVTFDERGRGEEDFGNGDGLLAYPGPLPSLRLKALRRGLQDRLLLLKLARCGAADEAESLARQAVPRALGEAGDEPAWRSSDVQWERARHELIDAILRRCHEA